MPDDVVQLVAERTGTRPNPAEATSLVEDTCGLPALVVALVESQWVASEFGGFVAAPGGAILTKPTARARQIEFIGDSLNRRLREYVQQQGVRR